MSSVSIPSPAGAQAGKRWLIWLPVIIGLVVMYAPVYHDLATKFWERDDQVHGPIVLAVALYLAWEAKSAFAPSVPAKTYPLGGSLLLLLGLLSYIIGHSQHIPMFDVGSQIPVLLGVLLLTLGWPGVKAFWFPLLFLVFMVPLPGFVVDGATAPLKQHVSIMAEYMLYAMGYPIARNGVVLTIGPYQLLVADACAGLHSIFSLSAMGLLYLYLMRHSSMLRNILLILCIMPMAIITNVIRVVVLALITYYWGDEAGQGFLHGFAGIMLFVTAVLGLFLIDWILGWFMPDKPLEKKSV